MTREEAVAKMMGISAKYERIGKLRNMSEALLLEEMPKQWKDGEAFFLKPELFDVVRAWMDEAYLLEGHSHREVFAMSILEYVGPNGTLKIKRGSNEL
jgi:hypothetical protein